MLIDRLTERFYFSDADLAVSVVIYTLAAFIALFVRRWAQVAGSKQGGISRSLSKTMGNEIPQMLWSSFFFVLTGCLKGPLCHEDRTEDHQVNRTVFLRGVLGNLATAGIAFLLYTGIEYVGLVSDGLIWQILLLATKALTAANLSLTVFALLPLPESDAEKLLRKKEFSPRGSSLRHNGTVPFFLFCTVGLLLANVSVSLPGGDCSLSGVVTLFPFLLIGG